jgi:glycosyltransferase involved in cell wall biosynthesis
MRILYDHQVFQNQNSGGISKYFVQLMQHLSPEIAYEIGLKYTNNIHLRELKGEEYEPLEDFQPKILKERNFKGKGSLIALYTKFFPNNVTDCYRENYLFSLTLLEKQDFDIFHPTYYDPYFLNYLHKPLVITVHDLIYELFPEFFPVSDQTAHQKGILISKADHIIAVSNKTKHDLIKHYGIDDSKISVIYHGVNKSDLTKVPDFKLPQRYLLYVGDRKGYKNFNFFIHSVSDILEKYELDLVCTGNVFTSEEKSLFETLNIFSRVHHHYVSENDLNILYRNALALIFPSLYEGFGMPILEAFANNCPVVLADTACFNEIAEDAALYFDPKSKHEICSRIEKISNDRDIRQSLILKGLQRVKDFSWNITASKTLAVYKSVASKPVC